MPTKKIIILVLIGMVLFSAIFGGSTYWNTAVKKSFPVTDGTIKIAGLSEPVRVIRDEMGIPHIYASNIQDLFFAEGYVHAQDRFWQMDFWRHIGAGELSSMFGKSQLETDIFLKTLGWKMLAEEEYETMDSESTAILDSYAAGVNAYIANKDGVEISLEYLVLKAMNPTYSPLPWTPVNTLTWAKAMAWDLRGNIGQEIERSVLLGTLTPEQVAELYPAYPSDHPVIAQDFKIDNVAQSNTLNTAGDKASGTLGISRLTANAKAKINSLDALLGKNSPSIGSNNWVISGKLSATGKPLLANDPHLGIQMPSIWYQIGLHCAPKSEACPYEVAGFSFAGVPGVVIGHNDKIAWAFTNTGPDVMDLFIEKINPENPDQYEYKGKWVDFEIRTETIPSSGGEPVEVKVRTSVHGPIISDAYAPLMDKVEPTETPFALKAGIDLPENYAIALRWTALEPGSVFQAMWGFNKASNWDEFREAAKKFVVPAQNLIYADLDGNIGYQMPGNVPMRLAGDGTIPVPGWTGEYDWAGYIPFEQLPSIFNPESGFIITANNQVTPESYPYLVTTDWDYGFRAQRIEDLIKANGGLITIDDFKRIQGDDLNLNAKNIIDVLNTVDLPEELKTVRDTYLTTWDYHENKSASAALYEAFWWSLVESTLADENMPKEYQPIGGSRTYEIFRNLIQQSDSAWWDDKSTMDKIEGRDEIFAKAFEKAVNCEVCVKKFGKDISKWDWTQLHTATFRNGTLGESGIGIIENIFNRGPIPTTGGESIVNATGWDIYDSFEVNWLPSMRMIVDLSDLSNSQTVHTTGQSGHAYHPHYFDMSGLWAGLKYYPMYWDEETIKSTAEGTLILEP
jgi:penicillin amidase